MCAGQRPVWSTPVRVRCGVRVSRQGEHRAMQPNGTERSKNRISGYMAGALAQGGCCDDGSAANVTLSAYLSVGCGIPRFNVAAIRRGAERGSKQSAGERRHLPIEEVRRPTERCSRRGTPWTLRPPRRPTTALQEVAAGAAGSRRTSRRSRPRAASRRRPTGAAWPRCAPSAGPGRAASDDTATNTSGRGDRLGRRTSRHRLHRDARPSRGLPGRRLHSRAPPARGPRLPTPPTPAPLPSARSRRRS